MPKGDVTLTRKDAQYLYRTCVEMLGMVNKDGYIAVTRFGVGEIQKIADFLGAQLSAAQEKPCEDCDGFGQHEIGASCDGGEITPIMRDCPSCSGTGKVKP